MGVITGFGCYEGIIKRLFVTMVGQPVIWVVYYRTICKSNLKHMLPARLWHRSLLAS